MNSFSLFPSAPVIGRISLGTATFGREITQDTAFALMDHARTRGINLFDTAANYSAGVSEKIVGAWLDSRKPRPDSLIVATKIYPPYAPDEIDKAVHASASRLGVGTIDLLYLHKWSPDVESPATLRALDKLLDSGRVSALGVSNFSAEQLSATLILQTRLGLSHFRVLQNNNNLAVRDVDAALRGLCARYGIAIITYSPLGSGYLTGKHRHGVKPGSRFDVSPAHQDVYFNALCEQRLAHLAGISERTSMPMAHLALAWAIHQPGICSVLIGGHAIRHLDQAYAALAFEAPSQLMELEVV